MTALVADPTCKRHDPGPGHPEQIARFDAVFAGLEKAALLDKLLRVEPREVNREDLQLAHDSAYLGLAEMEIRQGRPDLSTGDTSVSEHSWDAALRAAGSALAAVDAVVTGKAA